MTYQVIIIPNALLEIAKAYRWISSNIDERTAIDWYDSLMTAISSLQNFPKRCPLAPEAKDLEQEIRQLLVGKKRKTLYRVLFQVEADTVYVLYVRHSRRPRLNAKDVNDENEEAD
ncbi:MAG: type II toxin-antitoxin system RelE/ParE family toxin [Hydrococcus sp. C42_A2020_068]|nr:type II toxin-antitoxin system RelE/ParE family toxin [Hydrococcus sp. C42_A2020_068]